MVSKCRNIFFATEPFLSTFFPYGIQKGITLASTLEQLYVILSLTMEMNNYNSLLFIIFVINLYF
jgi:hypothetical protein